MSELYISDKEFVPLKTGVPDYKLLKHGPKHIDGADLFEPLYIHQESILEQCLDREASRIANEENLMNRVVYDSINESKLQNNQEENKTNANADKAPAQTESETNLQNPLNLPTVDNCDNNAKFE
jgi:hypothetical protein